MFRSITKLAAEAEAAFNSKDYPRAYGQFKTILERDPSSVHVCHRCK